MSSVVRKAALRNTQWGTPGGLAQRVVILRQASSTQPEGRFTNHPKGQSQRFRAVVTAA